MLPRLIIFLVILTSCQRRLIPCPEVEVIKFRERPANKQKSVLIARKEEPVEKNTTWKKPKDKVIQNVTIEEWDCPRPGKKKYMPRAVKQNIRKNERRIHKIDSAQFVSSTDRK